MTCDVTEKAITACELSECAGLSELSLVELLHSRGTTVLNSPTRHTHTVNLIHSRVLFVCRPTRKAVKLHIS